MKHWYLAYCHPREEERAKLHLSNQGVDSYYPLVLTEKVIRGKITQKIEPLFPRYIFVSLDLEEFSPAKIRSTRGIQRIIGHGANWDKVPEELIDGLRMREKNEEAMVSMLPKPGQKVIISEGPFRGLEAIYHEPDGNQRAILLLNMLHKDVPKSFDNREFKTLD